MAIASLQFLVFSIIVAVFYNISRLVWWRQRVLLIANFLFLTTFSMSIASYVPFVGFLVAGYAGIRLVETKRGSDNFLPILTGIILLFFWLKKYSFLPSSVFISKYYVTIGLSYIFFRVLHMLIDVHNGDLPAGIGGMTYLNYVINFPSLVSGPIQRYPDYARTQLDPAWSGLSWWTVGSAIERVVVGFFKVIVLAALLSAAHERMLVMLQTNGTFRQVVILTVALAVSYTFYLYCNFSGYTDIVIGIGQFMGLELPENFDRPFAATSFIEFWARWHMTLSNWLKTYVYNPLVKMLMFRFPAPRVEPYIGVFVFFITFFLIGLWHGQTAKFAVYGLLLGAGVSVNKMYQVAIIRLLGRRRYKAMTANSLYLSLSCALTFTWFTLSLFFFWASWDQINMIVRVLGTSGMVAVTLLMSGLATAIFPLASVRPWLDERLKVRGNPILRSRYVRTVWVTAMGMATALVLILMATPAPDIIYKNF